MGKANRAKEESKIRLSRIDGITDTIEFYDHVSKKNNGLSSAQLKDLKQRQNEILVLAGKAGKKWSDLCDEIMKRGR